VRREKKKKEMAAAPTFGTNDRNCEEPNPSGRPTRHVVEHCLRTSQAALREESSETRAMGTSVRVERDSSVKKQHFLSFF
jgi:hypothetical protein